jgi:glycosyltransferase involved in cell wall biosynthesis
MRIVQVVHRAPPHEIGGTEQYTLAMSRALAARGHECLILSGSDQTCSDPVLILGEHEGLSITRYASSLPPRYRGQWTQTYDPEADALIRRFLTMVRPDLVHVHHWMRLTSNLAALSTEMGIPTVVTLHDLWTSCPRGNRITPEGVFCSEPSSPVLCLNCAEREPWQDDQEMSEDIAFRSAQFTRELDLADFLLVPSSAQKALLQKVLGGVADRLRVVPHGSITDLRRRATAAMRRSPDLPLRLGYWGHLIPYKGPHLLIDAVRLLPDPRLVEVHIYGGEAPPWYEEQLRAAARGLPVQFHGPFKPADMARADLDVAVFPSLLHESYSFVLDEAFQCGFPVIVPDRGALPERAGEAGLVFAAEDPASLAARIQELLHNPERLDQLRQAIPASPSPTMEVHVEELEKIYVEARAAHRIQEGVATDYLALLARAMRQVAAREEKLEKLAELEANLAGSRQEMDRLGRDLAALDQARLAAEAHSAELESEMAHLHTELAAQNQPRGAAGARTAELEAERAQLQGDLAGLTEARLAAEAHSAELESEMAHLLARVSELETTLTRLQEDHANLRDHLLSLRRTPAFKFQEIVAKLSRR